MIRIEVKLTKLDIMVARLIFFIHGVLGVIALLSPLLMAVANYTFTSLGPVQDVSSPEISWLPFVVCWLIIPGSIAAAGINGAAVRKLLAPFEYEFSDTGICLIAPHVTGRFDWSDVRKMYETKKLIVFTTPGTLQIIPKRFVSSEVLASLKILVANNLQRKR